MNVRVIDDETKKRIRSIDRVVDFLVRVRLDSIVRNDDESKLDERVACIVKVMPGIPLPFGLRCLAGDLYTFRGTYRELIGVAEHPAVSYVEGSRHLSGDKSE